MFGSEVRGKTDFRESRDFFIRWLGGAEWRQAPLGQASPREKKRGRGMVTPAPPHGWDPVSFDLGEPLAVAPLRGQWSHSRQRVGGASMRPLSVPGCEDDGRTPTVCSGRHLFDLMCQLVGISWMFFPLKMCGPFHFMSFPLLNIFLFFLCFDHCELFLSSFHSAGFVPI